MGQWHNYRVAGYPALRICALAVMLCAWHVGYSQPNRYIKEGNKFYEKQDFKEATANYAKALSRDPNNVPGWFNLGNALYQEKQFDSSRKIMAAAEKKATDKLGKSAANYNIGNTYMAERKWEDAINSYKQTLRNNPQDADAKYNLAYAQQMMKKEQQQQKKDDKQKQDQKDKQDKQDKQKQNQDQNKDQKDKQDQDQKDKDKQEQNQPSKISKEQAERELDDFAQQEKKLQDKIKKEKGVPVKLQKDW